MAERDIDSNADTAPIGAEQAPRSLAPFKYTRARPPAFRPPAPFSRALRPTGSRASDSESVMGDVEFEGMGIEAQHEYLSMEIERRLLSFKDEKSVKLVADGINATLVKMDLDSDLNNVVVKGDSTSTEIVKARRLIQFIEMDADQATEAFGRHLVRRILTTDYSLDTNLQQWEEKKFDIQTRLDEEKRRILELKVLTSNEPSSLHLTELKYKKLAEEDLDSIQADFNEKYAAHIAATIHPNDSMLIAEATSQREEAWTEVKKKLEDEYQEQAQSEYLTESTTYRENKALLQQSENALTFLTEESDKVTIAIFYITSLQTIIRQLLQIVRSAINKVIPSIIPNLNKEFYHRSTRSGSNALNQSDLSGVLWVLKEQYKEASLMMLSQLLNQIFALKGENINLLLTKLTDIFFQIESMDLWKYMSSPQILQTIVIIKCVGENPKHFDLARSLNKIQLEQFKLITGYMQNGDTLTEALAKLDEPLPVQMRRTIESFDSAMSFGYTTTLGDKGDTRRSQAKSGTTDAAAYSAESQNWSSGWQQGNVPTPTDIALLVQKEVDRATAKFAGTYVSKPTSFTTSSPSDAKRSVSPGGRAWYLIREGDIPYKHGVWHGKVHATYPRPDLTINSKAEGFPKFKVRYTPTDDTGKSGNVEERQYQAEPLNGTEKDEKMKCSRCNLKGHRAIGCMQAV